MQQHPERVDACDEPQGRSDGGRVGVPSALVGQRLLDLDEAPRSRLSRVHEGVGEDTPPRAVVVIVTCGATLDSPLLDLLLLVVRVVFELGNETRDALEKRKERPQPEMSKSTGVRVKVGVSAGAGVWGSRKWMSVGAERGDDAGYACACEELADRRKARWWQWRVLSTRDSPSGVGMHSQRAQHSVD